MAFSKGSERVFMSDIFEVGVEFIQGDINWVFKTNNYTQIISCGGQFLPNIYIYLCRNQGNIYNKKLQLNFVLKRDPGVTVLQLLPMRHVVNSLFSKGILK